RPEPRQTAIPPEPDSDLRPGRGIDAEHAVAAARKLRSLDVRQALVPEEVLDPLGDRERGDVLRLAPVRLLRPVPVVRDLHAVVADIGTGDRERGNGPL